MHALMGLSQARRLMPSEICLKQLKAILKIRIMTKVKDQVQIMSMIALSLSLKLLIFKSLVLNMVLILKLWLIALAPLLPILTSLREMGTCIMNLLKTLA
jgi:hypothetical protein